MKRGAAFARPPNLRDYDAARAGFSWEHARRALSGLPGGRGLNMAYEAVDRHVVAGKGERTALRLLGRGSARREVSYAELKSLTDRFASALAARGIDPGERVFTLLGRVLELYVAALGTLKHRAVLCPLFSAFGPSPVQSRLSLGSAKLLVTTPALYRKKVRAAREALPSLRHVLLVGAKDGESGDDGVEWFDDVLAGASPSYVIGPTSPEDLALLHFTSGTTGKPKGALHVHEAVVAHHATGQLALDLQPGDVFWCTADPGWVTGTSYGILSPLTHGLTSVVDEEEFDAERWYATLERERVTCWYTAPTAIRMLMKAGPELARRHDLSALRFVASVGEPLNPEGVLFGQAVLGLPVHDNWWQTETGGIMVSNFVALDIKPGSMGRPLPGIDAAVVRRTADGGVELLSRPGEEGELALRPGWPSMFRGYLDDDARYRACFAGGWYLTGDLVRQDEEGYVWFVGRADDVIKSAGHLVSPFEVESALLEHPAVAEAGVIGKPEPVIGNAVKAFVSLKPGHVPGEPLRAELLGFARTRLGPAVAPREVAFLENLPRTRSGKIMRRLLRARELGLEEGDTSTLEVPA